MVHSPGEYALLFKAFSDETRLRIFGTLSSVEICACDILENLNITQSTLSYHMKMLTECGLVHSRKDGSWMKYTLNAERLNEMRQFIDHVIESAESDPPAGSGCC